MAKHPDWDAERTRIEHVIAAIATKKAQFAAQMDDVTGEMSDLRRHFFKDVTVNFADESEAAETTAAIKQQTELLAERERTFGQALKQSRVLERMEHSPYFARIDFVERIEGMEQQVESIYLGIGSLLEEGTQRYYVYDWRAPISNLYYDFVPGPASYETPIAIIEGDMLLKRQLIIRRGELQSMFDTGMSIGDDLLQQVLSERSDAAMKTIVATIQKEQNVIIRDESHRLLLVQGAAGSGKTSAALQRVAYLLYRYRNTITAEQIVLFSPNPMFNHYVSQVLPELGEQNMVQTTLNAFIESRMRQRAGYTVLGPYEQLEFEYTARMDDPDDAARLHGIEVKTSSTILQAMDEFIEQLSTDCRPIIFRDIKLGDNVIIGKAEISERFQKVSSKIAMFHRIDELARQLLDLLRQREKMLLELEEVAAQVELLDQQTIDAIVLAVERKTGYSDGRDIDRALRTHVVHTMFRPLRRMIRRYKFVHIEQLYVHFLKQVGRSHETNSWDNLLKVTIRQLRTRTIGYEDGCLLLYLWDSICGFETNTFVRHLLLDEVQDYSAIQFAYLRKLYPESRLTCLGDVNQRIHVGNATSGALQTLWNSFTAEQRERIVLSRSYRSTRPIIRFTSALLGPEGDAIEPFNRDGEVPRLTRYVKREQHASGVADLLLKWSHYRNVAIICKSAAECEEAHEALMTLGVSTRLIRADTTTFEEGIVVVPSYLSKGVEFDAVLVWDVSAHIYQREEERRVLYTVCTRAMHELHLFACGSEWSKLLNEQALQLCTIEERVER